MLPQDVTRRIAGTDAEYRGKRRWPAGLCRALMGDALDDPELFAPRQARAAGQHAKY
jgi:hypothetical protein